MHDELVYLGQCTVAACAMRIARDAREQGWNGQQATAAIQEQFGSWSTEAPVTEEAFTAMVAYYYANNR